MIPPILLADPSSVLERWVKLNCYLSIELISEADITASYIFNWNIRSIASKSFVGYRLLVFHFAVKRRG